MKAIPKAIAAGVLSLWANHASAQEKAPDVSAASLTADAMAGKLSFPVSSPAFYHNSALGVAIREECVAAPDNSVIHCTLDVRANQGMMALRLDQSYRIENGAVTIATRSAKDLGWSRYAITEYKNFRESAGTQKAQGDTSIARSFGQEGLPQNNIYSRVRGEDSVAIRSVMPVSDHRAFYLGLEFDAARQTVGFTVQARVAFEGVTVSGEPVSSSRGWTRGDKKFYDKYKSMGPVGKRNEGPSQSR